MRGFALDLERRDLASRSRPTRVGLRVPLRASGRSFAAVTVAQDFNDPPPGEAGGVEAPRAGRTPALGGGLWLTPLRTPLAASGFTAHSLELLRKRCAGSGLLPMQAGAASPAVLDEEKDVALVPGGPLAVSLVRGDFDLSGIGTVTHVEG